MSPVATVLRLASPFDEPDIWWKLAGSVCLILAGGAFSGLTLGLMGLDDLHLRVLSSSSDNAKEKMDAQSVLNLLNKGRHWVLVTLLLSNVLVNESLPIFLDSAIGGGIAAVAISTTMIVIFGECVFPTLDQLAAPDTTHRIIPQAVCVRYGLSIGARAAPFVLCLMWLLSPIAWPTAKLLDRVLGTEGVDAHTYKKAELRSFLQFHRQGVEPLRADEVAILNGVLSLNERTVGEIMTHIQDVATLSYDAVLDQPRVERLLESGYSRIPVHEPGNPTAFIGLLLLKKLLTYDPHEKRLVSSFPLSVLPEAAEDINCFQALDYFQTGRAHLLLISKTPGQPSGAVGIVTLEDVIEEIISEEIVDETDLYESNASRRRAKRVSNAAVMKGIVERKRRAPEPPTETTRLVNGGAGRGAYGASV